MASTCIRCGSNKLADGVEVRISLGQREDVSKLQSVRLAVDLDPKSSKFLAGAGKEYVSCGLTARVCADCGHVELVADDGLRLYTAQTGMKLFDR